MKRIFTILAMAALLLTGCEKDEIPSTPQEPQTVLTQSANCYIISAAGSYKFRATKGNTSESVGEVASAAVLWESFGTDQQPSVGDLVKDVSYKDGEITFKATDRKGNAVIAAKDAAGNILWSWHIWMTDQPKEQEYYNNAGTMMDRNLGATSATPGDVGARGLLYQWGRKDPFLGSSSISDDNEAKSTITWPSAVSSDSSNGTIAYAIANPTTFITENRYILDWYYTDSDPTYNTRWTTSANTKSIYDPCPAGWRVPDSGKDGVWSKALGSSSEFKNVFENVDRGMNFSGKFGSDQTIWYPAPGFRGYSDGSFSKVAYYGLYWAASTYGQRANNLCIYDDGTVASRNGSRAYGCSVRCIKE